jgi:hypothetical protein
VSLARALATPIAREESACSRAHTTAGQPLPKIGSRSSDSFEYLHFRSFHGLCINLQLAGRHDAGHAAYPNSQLFIAKARPIDKHRCVGIYKEHRLP